MLIHCFFGLHCFKKEATYNCYIHSSVCDMSFSLANFKIFFLSLVASNLITICVSVVLLIFLRSGYFEFLYLWVYSFCHIWKIFSHYFFRIFVYSHSLWNPITHILSSLNMFFSSWILFTFFHLIFFHSISFWFVSVDKSSSSCVFVMQCLICF